MWKSDTPSACSACGQPFRTLDDFGGVCIICSNVFCSRMLWFETGWRTARRARKCDGAGKPTARSRRLMRTGSFACFSIISSRPSDPVTRRS